MIMIININFWLRQEPKVSRCRASVRDIMQKNIENEFQQHSKESQRILGGSRVRSRGSSRKSSRESSGEHIKSIFLSQMLEGIRVRVKPCRGLFTSYLLHNITFLPNVFTCFNHKKILQILEFIHNSCTFVQNISVISFIVQILLSMQQMFLIIILFLSGLFLNKNKTCF